MTSPDVTARLYNIIAQQLDVDESKVVPSASFMKDLGADSLDLTELIMSLEDEFNVKIPDEIADKIETVGDALAYLEQHMAT
ncbi:MAG: acyl carrier protein [Chloroflexaceae bacterium]|nr:acyl carrier protein [Chloroflexaceae bacterium]